MLNTYFLVWRRFYFLCIYPSSCSMFMTVFVLPEKREVRQEATGDRLLCPEASKSFLAASSGQRTQSKCQSRCVCLPSVLSGYADVRSMHGNVWTHVRTGVVRCYRVPCRVARLRLLAMMWVCVTVESLPSLMQSSCAFCLNVCSMGSTIFFPKCRRVFPDFRYDYRGKA